MRKKSIILGSVLLLIGGTALGWGLIEIQRKQDEIATYQSRYSAETVDLMKQYNAWLLLPEDDKPAFPVLLDKDGNTKTLSQLRLEQHERLTADLDKLASSQVDVSPFVDVLYGESWPSEIEAYKKRKGLNESVLTGSIVCTSTGGLIYVWWLLLGAARMMARGLTSLKQRLADSKAMPSDEVNEENDTIESSDAPSSTESLTEEEQTIPESNQRAKHQKVLPTSNWGHWKAVQDDPEIKAEVNQIKRISNEVERIDSLLSDEKTTRVKAVKVKPLAGRDSSKPLDNTLKQLSEEVSAIREYTTYQQDQWKDFRTAMTGTLSGRFVCGSFVASTISIVVSAGSMERTPRPRTLRRSETS